MDQRVVCANLPLFDLTLDSTSPTSVRLLGKISMDTGAFPPFCRALVCNNRTLTLPALYRRRWSLQVLQRGDQASVSVVVEIWDIFYKIP